MKKRLVSLVLTIAMVLTLIPANILTASAATNVDPSTKTYTATDENDNGLNLTKSVKKNDDGTYTVTLEAYATGTVVTTTTETSLPADIVLVLDVSGSMGDVISTPTGDYRKIDVTNVTAHYTDSLYTLYKGEYVPVTITYSLLSGRYTYKFSNQTETSYYTTGKPPIDLYQLDIESTTKLEALKNSVNAFINSVYLESLGADGEKGTSDDVSHRIAIVTYASDANTVKGLTSVLSDSSSLVSAVNSLSANGATAADYGMTNAYNIINSAYVSNPESSKAIVMFTDGEPNHGNGFVQSVADATISKSNSAKALGASVYTIGIFDDSVDSRTPGYMISVASSASQFLRATDASSLTNIFTTVSNSITSTSSLVDLGTDTIVKDIIADNFTLPTGADASSVKLYTSAKNADGSWGSRTDASLTKAVNGKTVSINGFDFAGNCVTTTAKEDGTYGKKLIIEFNVVPENDTFGGNAFDTNGANSGVYDDNGILVENFPMPKADIDINYDFAIATENNRVHVGSTVDLATLITTADGFVPDGTNNADVNIIYTINNGTDDVVTFELPAGTAWADRDWSKTVVADKDTTYNVTCTVTPVIGSAYDGTITPKTLAPKTATVSVYSYVNFVDSNDGTTVLADQQTVDYYQKANNATPSTVPQGYVFDKWYTDKECTTEYDFNTPVVADTTLYAGWKALPYVLQYFDGDSLVGEAITIFYDATVTIKNALTKAGYTFQGWFDSFQTKFDADSNHKVTFDDILKTVKDDVVNLYAKWTANADTPYTVEYYYAKNGKYSDTATSSDTTRKAVTDTNVSVTDDDKKPTESGYAFDSDETSNVLSGNVNGDGSLVLKVYFKEQFSVTYKPGEHGTFQETSTGSLDYGVATPAAPTTTGDAGYSFAGWDKEIAKTVTDDVTYTALWTANTNTPYKVEYYYQDANGQYPTTASSSVERTGTTDTTASVTDADKTPTGSYVYDTAAANVESGNIAGDGSLVLKVYFKNQYEVTYKPGDHGTFQETSTGSLDYGVATPAAPETTGDAGYTFNGWSPAVAETVTANAEYVAQWKANEDTAYKVEYYYAKDGVYPTLPTATSDRTGTTDETVAVLDTDKVSTEAGYVFDTAAGNVLTGTVNGDGTLVLKVYFKEQFSVTYTKGDHGTFADQVYGNLDYNAATPSFDGEKTGYAGYIFDKWQPLVPGNVTGNAIYVAQWLPKDDTVYTIQYFYQKNGVYSETPDNTKTAFGTTDTTATVTDADKTPTKDGYAFDNDAANVVTGTIAGDGSLVLKVYFKEQFSVTYDPGDKGTFKAQTTTGIDYDDETPAFKGEPTGAPGYSFDGWTPEVAETVTGDVTYVAQWTADTDTKYTVEYYYQGADGKYPATASSFEERTGTTDTTVSVTADDKIPEGSYVYDTAAANVESGTIAGDGSLVLKVYFKNQYEVTYKPGDHGTFDSQTKSGIDYNAATPGFSGEKTGDAGYTFTGWSPEVAEKVTANAEYVAQWEANKDTAYKVEYYYAKDGVYPTLPTATSDRTGTTDETVVVLDTDKVSTEAGYVFDTAAGNVLTGTVNGDGTLVLKVYFKEQFSVTYAPGEHGTFEAQTTTGIDYNAATPAFSGEKTGEAGYTFAGWDEEIADTVTGNVTYTAQWTINNYDLTVHYVYEDETPAAEDYTDEVVYKGSYEVESPVIPGYTADVEVVEGTMPADDVEVTVTYTANNDTAYTVQYFYQENGVYPDNPNGGTRTDFGTTGATVSVKDTDKTPTEAGYAYDTAAANVESGNIAGDGSLVLKVYFKEQFTVTYKPGDHGTFQETSTGSLDYGVATPAAPETTGEEGYTFAGWDKTIADIVTGNATYTAKWTINSHDLVIDYQYADRTKAADQHKETLTYGSEYEVTSPVIPGCTADIEVVDGTMGDADAKYIVTYTANQYDVTVNHIKVESDGTKTIADTNTTKATYGESFTADVNSYDNYTFDSANSDALTINPVTGGATINLYYVRNTHTITIIVIDEDGNETETEIPVDEGSEYDVTDEIPDDKEGTTKDVTGDPTTGTVEDDITIVVKYERNEYNLVIHYVYEDGRKAADDYVGKVTFEDAYSVDSPVIANYKVDKANVSGTMPARDVEVTVTYSLIPIRIIPDTPPVTPTEPATPAVPVVTVFDVTPLAPVHKPMVVNVTSPLLKKFMKKSKLVELEDETPLSAAPNTGDESPIFAWTASLVASFAGAVVVTKRKKNEED